MSPWVLMLIFIVSAVIGYKLISSVPTLLHTPLMSGMNALSGITVLGAIYATVFAVSRGNQILAYVALLLAMINVVGGLGVTHRMLMMFKKRR